MDWGSSLIFIGLAVAWAAYLIPVAIKHHDEADRSRTVDRFSESVRVLARREAVDKRNAKLVTPGQPAEVAPTRATARAAKKAARLARKQAAREAAAARPAAARRAAAKRATKRRRNVLALILLANAAVVGVAAFGVISWWYAAIPASLLVGWLVACRLMVRHEHAVVRAPGKPAATPAAAPVAEPVDRAEAPAVPAEEPEAEIDPMEDTSAGIAAVVDPAMWDPVPVTLPTYVSKPTAERRSVRTIDLEATGVWTSGRTEADAQLAREADEAEKAARRARRDGDDQRAVGS